MSSGRPPYTQSATSSDCATTQPVEGSHGVDHRVHEIAGLLESLNDAAAEGGLSAGRAPDRHEQRLVEARLGVASSLYTALRYKHASTANHCLRVALGCSAWAEATGLQEGVRCSLEIAALLHDVGKIGVPEAILHKPARLTPEEAEVMTRHRLMAVDILSSCCATADVLEFVRYATAWYDGSRYGLELKGTDIPLGARMLAIVDAFDSMVTEHVYRPARSRERALAELFEFAGTQFDPDLVRAFHDFLGADRQLLRRGVSGHWLRAIAGQQSGDLWQLNPPSRLADDQEETVRMFEAELFENVRIGVVFVDSCSRMFVWNTGAEKITGLAASTTTGSVWSPGLLDLRSEKGRRITDEECPVGLAIRSGVQSLTRLSISGRSGRDVTVDLHAIPVERSDGARLGAVVVLEDASPEASLEQRCQQLQSQAATDSLTRISNRAEFDRLHDLVVQAHLQSGLPCSLIICDIDHFKFVNDTYGHQAGDEVLRNFAALLRSMCRSGDVLARYGGEEFVVLCADCNNASAANRAEQFRKKLSETSQPALGNKGITASFGVTELQPGDTPETMLRRADRALLQAKDQGRNQVIQLGSGMSEKETKKSWWPFGSARHQSLVDRHLVTNVPMEVVVQKLHGVIADHAARITSTGEDHLFMEVSGENAGSFRRADDRPIPFLIEMKFKEERVHQENSHGLASGEYVQTRVHIIIRPKKERDRRRQQSAERARHLLFSVKSYLMAKEEADLQQPANRQSTGIDIGEPLLQGGVNE